MKSRFLALVLISGFSFSAHADYFKCEIEQMGTVLASAEAEYRVLSASVAVDGYLCEGKITSNQTQVKLTDLVGNRASEASQRSSQASTSLSTVQGQSEYDVICSCGMN